MDVLFVAIYPRLKVTHLNRNVNWNITQAFNLKNIYVYSYAFVEFENTRDAEDAFNEMHGRTIEGYTLSVQVSWEAPNTNSLNNYYIVGKRIK